MIEASTTTKTDTPDDVGVAEGAAGTLGSRTLITNPGVDVGVKNVHGEVHE